MRQHVVEFEGCVHGEARRSNGGGRAETAGVADNEGPSFASENHCDVNSSKGVKVDGFSGSSLHTPQAVVLKVEGATGTFFARRISRSPIKTRDSADGAVVLRSDPDLDSGIRAHRTVATVKILSPGHPGGR